MALKFKDFSFANNRGRFILVVLSAIVIIVLAVMKTIWLAWPIIFILYVLLSLLYKEPVSVKTPENKTLDATV